MVHTVDAVIYDPLTGNLWGIVIPDDDRQLNDPAYNPPGFTQLRVAPLAGLGPMDVTTNAIAACAAKGVTVQLAPVAGATGATGATGPTA